MLALSSNAKITSYKSKVSCMSHYETPNLNIIMNRAKKKKRYNLGLKMAS